MPKTLIVYAYYETADSRRNLSFFLRHGISACRDREYVIVINGSCTIEGEIPSIENLKVVKRNNTGFDFGAWAHVLRDLQPDHFDYFFFLNSSVIGPFLPQYQDSSTWPDVFSALLNDRVKLAGITINVYEGDPHVQSMFLGTDRLGLKLLIDAGIFANNDRDVSKHDVIARREIPCSKVIIAAGFGVDCLAAEHHKRSTNTLRKNKSGDIVYPGGYLGHTLEPLDTCFFKTNRGCSPAALERAIQLADYKRSTSAERCFQESRIRRGIDVLKQIPSAWQGHVEFAIWLTCRFHPRIVVDLGVDYGVSTYAWGISGRAQVIGIDWFQGDAHAGFRDTYAQVLGLGAALAEATTAASTVRIWKSSFEQAAAEFQRPVDILHLDGLHTYEAVQEDLKNWLPKLSPGGLLVMHDVQAFPGSVGRAYAELPFHKIAFDHSAGLGVASADAAKIAAIDREWKQNLRPSPGGLTHQEFDHLQIQP